MSKTVGFYLIEKHWREYQTWPTSQGLRGLGPTILVFVNAIWALYPIIIDFINYKTNFTKCLLHMQIIILAALMLSGNIQQLRNQNHLFEMINLLSDFNQFGIPEGIKFVEKKFKTILKIIRYGGFLLACLMTYFIMLKDDCVNFENTKHCTIFVYYVPFDLKLWQMTLIMLFQIHTLNIAFNTVGAGIALYCYSLELLVVRIENLKAMIGNINLTRNKKRNCNILRPIVLHHQDIFRMFQLAKTYFNTFIVPQKIFGLICLTLSTTGFVLKKDFICFCLIISTLSGLFIIHTMGERLITAASSVADSVYELNWYDAHISTRKDILILLSMSQKALVLEAPLFGRMSHSAAAVEFKKVYYFFNSLLTITKKRNF